MGIVKHGHGEILPEEGDDQRTASQNWTDQDREELDREIADEDDE